MRIVIIFICNFLIVSFLSAQTVIPRCGVSIADQDIFTSRLQENILAVEQNLYPRNNAVVYIPIRFHVVSNDNGSGGASNKSIMKMLCRLNANYLPINIQFYIKDQFNTFSNSTVFNSPMSNAANTKMNSVRDKKALNIYVTGSAGEEGVLGFYNPSYDLVVLPKSEMNQNTHTGSHEIGHFFSLRHTFYGWEGCPYKESEAGNPIESTTVPCSGLSIEWVDRSNCKTAADLICDTPEDYNFGYGWNNCVPYNKIVQDIHLDTCNPMENNYMGYFFNCGDYIFTPQQQAVMLADLNSSKRNYLKSTYTPAALEVGEEFIPLSPINGVTVDSKQPIFLSWQPVTGATRYLLEISNSSVFTESRTTIVEVLTNSYTIPANTLFNTTYYYRITPYNEYATCNDPVKNDIAFFKASDAAAVRQIDGISNWVLAPSVLKKGEELTSMLSSSKSMQIQLRITNSLGINTGYNTKMNVTSGESNWSIPTDDLTPGVYFMTLTNRNGMLIRRFIIQ
ncbi:MAG TPA: T9SS type A sorting domain-containing protein [Saprospiraceae bacterium]|nr:T9SS type A sorting domain-containing protein [Saprospiraceae bacterium]